MILVETIFLKLFIIMPYYSPMVLSCKTSQLERLSSDRLDSVRLEKASPTKSLGFDSLHTSPKTGFSITFAQGLMRGSAWFRSAGPSNLYSLPLEAILQTCCGSVLVDHSFRKAGPRATITVRARPAAVAAL